MIIDRVLDVQHVLLLDQLILIHAVLVLLLGHHLFDLSPLGPVGLDANSCLMVQKSLYVFPVPVLQVPLRGFKLNSFIVGASKRNDSICSRGLPAERHKPAAFLKPSGLKPTFTQK